ncbi:MAG: glycerol-3-phosphate 1-O-acyltransferase PlsY [Acidobacteria bacterium]|nr:glycerol-3-phosphate 1-O-acyltransferase PlsY [Acidobacteriota bacterium]
MGIELLSAPLAYFLGSVPFGYVFYKLTTGKDIRRAGSGNIGATNVFRKSRWIGILTLLADGGKGYLAVLLAAWLGAGPEWQAAAAVAAIAGHVFSVWLGFKGGKGVATGCGAYLALAPAAVGTTLAVFVLTVLATRFISLASILAAATFPLWAFLYGVPHPLLAGALLGSAIIIAKHHQNLRRLMAGTESKLALGKRP